MTRLVIIGAGPKAIAVAAKAHVLRELGCPAPEVAAVEARSVAGNWTAAGGWTDGSQRLGTSPEKDLGFPYRSNLLHGRGGELSAAMSQFSWQAHLIERGSFAEWVDRGKPNPKHRGWAEYLRWAAAKARLEVVNAEAVGIHYKAGRWQVRAKAADGVVLVEGDALMVTGPGHAGQSLLPGCPQVLSVARFWQLVMRRQLPEAFRVAVVGGGETAAAVLNELVEHREINAVTVVSPNPTLYTRGESYFENKLYSDPSGWPALPLAERRELIRRTDRGVFSAHAQEELLRDDRIGHLRGRVAYAAAREQQVDLVIRNPGAPESTQSFDLVVDATGVRPLWFLDLFAQEALDVFELAVGWPTSHDAIEATIGHDLSVTGLEPKLFLPGLAGLAQGPGFPNLSCLGLLSDRVLESFVSLRASIVPAHASG